MEQKQNTDEYLIIAPFCEECESKMSPDEFVWTCLNEDCDSYQFKATTIPEGIKRDENILDVREELAALCHEQWSGWMRYLFRKTLLADHVSEYVRDNFPNGKVIPAWAVDRWQRQIETPYEELSEEEKDSDRKEADKFIKFFHDESALLLERTFMQDRIIEDLKLQLAKARERLQTGDDSWIKELKERADHYIAEALKLSERAIKQDNLIHEYIEKLQLKESHELEVKEQLEELEKKAEHYRQSADRYRNECLKIAKSDSHLKHSIDPYEKTCIEELKAKLTMATRELCSCGGGGPDDHVCDICSLYHMMELGK